MPIAVPYNRIEYKELREPAHVFHGIGRASVYLGTHSLGIANPTGLVFTFGRKTKHLAKILLMLA